MNKTYQKPVIHLPDALELAVPEHETVAISEIAANMQEAVPVYELFS